MRSETGKRPQAPSNLPLQPLKKQNDMTFGQPRKLCLSGGVLPRAIEHRPPRSTFSIFSRSVFSTPSYFQGRPNFGVLRRFAGGFQPRATHVRACASREFGPFLAFPLFRRNRYSVPTTRKTPRSHHQRMAESGVTIEPRAKPSRDGDAQKHGEMRRSSVDFSALAVYLTVGLNAISSFGVGRLLPVVPSELATGSFIRLPNPEKKNERL